MLRDANNNVIALTDANQQSQTQYRYQPYGTTTATGSADVNPQQYTGRENDGTGLYYYRNRYYSPATARFVSEDPIGWASGQTNAYAYVGGNPVQFADPYGLGPWDNPYGLPKNFWNWYHDSGNMKGEKGPNGQVPKDEARGAYLEWLRLGKPGPECK